ncbi:MAG: T9SS type A sorting domain-containing protein [Calditrichia bacterium]
MKFITVIVFVFLLAAFGSIGAVNTPDFSDLYIQAEENPAAFMEAKRAAIAQGLPVSILTRDGTFIHVISSKRNRLLYAVITNPRHPRRGALVADYRQIANRFNLSGARIYYGNGRIVNPRLGLPVTHSGRISAGDSLLLVPDWTGDRVMAFDAYSGDLVDAYFIPTHSAELASPKSARQSPAETISISDQIRDLVQEFDTSGTYLGIMAPAGGVNNDILDNVRGHAYRPNGNLVVTVASGLNSDAVAEFDPSGNYLGNFIAVGAGGLDSPFDIIFRSSDVLVSGSGSDYIHRYDLDGNYLDNFTPVNSYPQQLIEFPNGDIGVANFSGNTGVLVYSSTGTLLKTLTGVSGNRGVWQLGNGNILTTNGSGVYELHPVSGVVLRTLATGVSAQFIHLYSAVSTTVFSHNVEQSWNLIGLPLEVSDPYYLSLYPDAISGTLFRWDGSYIQEDTLEAGYGYWLRFPSAGSYPVSGSPVNSLSMNLLVDWNLVSGPSCDMPVSNISDPGGIIIPGTVFGFNGSYYPADTIKNGESYWVRSNAAGQISMACGSRGSARLAAALKNMPDISRNPLLRISDAAGATQTLYFDVKLERGQKQSFSLPPLPPQGAFDVRFAGNYRVVENGSGRILLQASRYPLKICTENLPLAAGYRVEEILGNGETGQSRLLKNGASIEIRNPQVKSLQVTETEVIPKQLRTVRNYPNPFNPSTEIHFQLAAAGQVTLKVYDVLGREVAQLVNGRKAAGDYRVQWNASGFPSGIYVYQLFTEAYSQTGKMVLMR